MQSPDVQSPHRLVEFLTAISRCQDSAGALRAASELVAEELDAEVGAVVLGQTVCATVGFGQREVPHAALAAIVPGTGSIRLDGIGTCHSLAAAWNAGTDGRLLVARTEPAFVSEDRNLMLGMAGALGMALDMIGALERERGRQRVLEVLLGIQRSISHRAPLSTILAAVTDGASTVLQGCPVSLILDDAFDPERPIVAGADLTRVVATVSAPVHIHGIPAGALIASTQDGAPVGPVERSLLNSFAEHASLALTDARTVEAMREAFRDPLTGLPNRPLFLDRLTQALRQRDPLRSSLSVLFIDLDRFKAINDSLGHAAGDTLLHAVADRICGCTRSDATAARFGGDEFALLLQGYDDPTFAGTVAERIIAALREPFSIQDKFVFIGATIGIAHADADHPELGADDLLSNADLAMYRAKAAGGGRALTYDPQMRVALLARLDLQAQLQGALVRDELVLYYQPIVELDTGLTTGLEALLRWRHPERGMIAPSEFIPIAETTGMIVAIGRWVLVQACQQLARWRQIDPCLTMNVNVSVHQLRDRSFPTEIERALRETRLPGDALILEITESVLIEDQELIFGTLRTLKQLGVAIALDDFGTGYSSLGYLHKFPVDVLKIDRSFISGAASQTGGDQLIRTIIELGRAYHLEVVAEGIEDESQRTRLRELGCRRGQGYHFARPTDAAGIESYFAAQRTLWVTTCR
jgi:diguanylate cyclase (GGDEF)-like protein